MDTTVEKISMYAYSRFKKLRHKNNRKKPPCFLKLILIKFRKMAMLTTEIKEFVRTQKLGFIATVCPDGTPNLSPKGTTNVWDDDHLMFADIYSPGTINNLLHNPAIEINIVNIFIRKGYRFKGIGKVLSEGPLFEEVVSFYKANGASYIIKNVVLVKVERILPLVSPVYDTGASEEEVKTKWINYWNSVETANKLA